MYNIEHKILCVTFKYYISWPCGKIKSLKHIYNKYGRLRSIGLITSSNLFILLGWLGVLCIFAKSLISY